MRVYMGESKKAERDAIKWARNELKFIKIKEKARKEIEEGYKIFIRTGKFPFEKDLATV